MKFLPVIAAMCLSSYAMVGNFDDSNLTIGLFKQSEGSLSTNTGNVIPVIGPNAPALVTATFDRVPANYGWRSDLQSYCFDSTTSNIKFSNDIGSFAENKLTVACWLKMADLTREKNIWAKVVSYTTKIVIHRQHTDTFEIRVCDGNGKTFIDFLRPAGNADPNTWFSLITVIDVTQAENTDRIKVYINGIPCAIAGTPGVIPTALPYLDTTALRVGGWGAGDPKVGINGEMKYMLTFNTAKSPAEVSALYALGPDLGGLALDSNGKLYSTATYISYHHQKRIKSAGVNSYGTNQIRFRAVDLLGRNVDTRILTGGSTLNNNHKVQPGRSGYYILRKTDSQTGEISRKKELFLGN